MLSARATIISSGVGETRAAQWPGSYILASRPDRTVTSFFQAPGGRHLRYDSPDPAVGRAEHQHMAAAVTRAPNSDPRWIDLRLGFQKRDRPPPIRELAPGSMSCRIVPSLAPKFRWSRTSATK